MNPPGPPPPSSMQTGNNNPQHFSVKPINPTVESPVEEKIEYQPPSEIPIDIDSQFNQLAKENGYQELPVRTDRYHMMDLFWLINQKMGKQELHPREAHFTTISFNIDFGNLRINLYSIPKGAIVNNVVFNQSLNLLTYGTIYPSSCYRLVNSSNIEQFICMEQLFNKTGEQWQKERPICKFEGFEKAMVIRLTITNPMDADDFYFYDFSNWQMDCLIESCKFVYQQGFMARAYHVLRRQ